MKISIFIILIVGLVSQCQVAFSQWACATPDTSANMSYNLELSKMSIFQPRSFDDVTLRVYFHVIRNSSGAGGYTYAHVQESFNFLQEDFNKHGIHFAWDCQINYIDDSYYYTNPGSNPPYRERLFKEVNNPDGVDIFLIRLNSYVGGFAHGVGNESQLAITGWWHEEGIPIGLSSVISHEMGHVLFLWHTHRGCETGHWEFSENYPIDTVNCEVAGDFLCDTPADPNMNFNVDPISCEWNGEAHEWCEGQAPEPMSNYNPDATNIMSYSVPSCLSNFTDEQVQKMHNAIETLPFLQQCVVDEPFVYENFNCISSPEFSAIRCLLFIDDLQDLLLNYIPTGFELIFGDEIDPESTTFSQINPLAPEVGTFYGFFYHPSSDFFGPASEPIVIIECCDFGDIVLSKSTDSNDCPELYIDLNNYYTSTPPSDAVLVWSTSTDPESEPFSIIDPFLSHVHTATYYAFYYNEEDDCYSEPSTGIEITIQSCCNVTDNVYISGNEIFDTPRSIGGNIFIEDQGTLTITNYLEMGEDKRIIVEEGGKLVIQGSSAVLTVCNSSSGVWNGIRVLAGGELKTRGGKILNARNGIYAQSDLITYTIPPPVIDIQGIEIVGNSLSDITRGITLFGVTPVNLSESSIENYNYGIYLWGGVGYNVIKNLELKDINFAGIYSIYSNFRVEHSKFINTGIGINAIQSNYGSVQSSIFEDLHTGISTWNSRNMVIFNNEMYLDKIPNSIGVDLRNTPQSWIFNNDPIQTEEFGVYAFNSPDIEIKTNNFVVGDPGIQGQTQSGMGIYLTACSRSIVELNVINMLRGRYGIRLENSATVEIKNNEISNASNSNSIFNAIDLRGSSNNNIESNSMTSVENRGFGILIINSPGNSISCNVANSFHMGIRINPNSESQIIRGNVLDGNLDLHVRSEIGQQFYHGNLFMGGTVLGDGLDFQQLSNSLFLVNSEFAYHMPSNPVPGNNQWFIDLSNPSFYECPDGTNIPEQWIPFDHGGFDLCDYYSRLKTLKPSNPTKFYLSVFDLLYFSESLQDFIIPNCILLDSDFQSLCGLEEMVDIVNDLEKYGQHELATDSLISYQHQWLETTDSIQLTQLDSLIGEELASLSSGFETARTQDSILLTSIGSDLNAINCGSVLVTTWKGIYQQYLTFLQNGEVDSSDHNTLKQYSSLCSDIYGKPIHLARAVTATFDTTYYDQYDDCLQGLEQRIIREQAIEEAIEIWPNPTTGSVRINLPDNYSGTLAVMDISGKKVHVQSIRESNFINLEMPFQNGMYIFRFESAKGNLSKHRVLLIK